LLRQDGGVTAEAWAQQLEAWHDFYVILGAAAAQLTGLMFVVVSLRTPPTVRRSPGSVRAFLTPTVVFFATILLVSAAITMPPLPRPVLGGLLVCGGVCALSYMAITRVHRRWRESNLDRMDWFWYAGLPFSSYVLLAAAGVGVLQRFEAALYVVAVSMLLLLINGIRNAWDLVIWLTRGPMESSEQPAAP
jgi:hypothetical protein